MTHLLALLIVKVRVSWAISHVWVFMNGEVLCLSHAFCQDVILSAFYLLKCLEDSSSRRCSYCFSSTFVSHRLFFVRQVVIYLFSSHRIFFLRLLKVSGY